MRNLLRSLLSALLACILFALPCLATGEILKLPIDFSGGVPINEKYEQGKTTYDDPSIHVVRTTESNKEFSVTVYTVDITIANATQLRTESAGGGEKGFKSRQEISVAQMAKRVNAVVALTGDSYEKTPTSFLLRQGILFREVKETLHDLLLIDQDGDFHVILAGNRDTVEGLGNTFPAVPLTTEELTCVNGKKVINGFEFGPCIILNGEEVEANPRSVVHPKKSQSWNRSQRICLCQIGPLHYRIIAVAHFGLSVQDMAKLALSYGDVQTAYMLDGGESVQVVFLGKKINNTQSKSIRPIGDCIYFASAYQPD